MPRHNGTNMTNNGLGWEKKNSSLFQGIHFIRKVRELK